MVRAMILPDNIFSIIGILSMIGAAILAMAIILRSLLHIGISIFRRIRGHPPDFVWSKAVPLLLPAGCFLLGLLLEALNNVILPTSGYLEFVPSRNFRIKEAVSSITVFIFALAFFVFPIFFSLIKARIASRKGWWARRRGSTLKTLLLMLTLPGAMSWTVTMFEVVDTHWNGRDFVNERAGHYFIFSPSSRCGIALQSFASSVSAQPKQTNDWTLVSEYWLNATIDGLTLGLPSLTGCTITRVDINRDIPIMVVAALLYHFLMLGSLAIILYSVYVRWRNRAVRRFSKPSGP